MATRKIRREAILQPEMLEDLRYWARADRKVLVRTMDLIEAVVRDPFNGIGKPEPLRGELQGCWSRRITEEHRLVYRVADRRVDFLQGRYHYSR